MSNFDGLQQGAFTTVENLYGDVAVWSPSNSQTTVSGLCLFSNPNDPIIIGQGDKYEYRPYNFALEYFESQFTGLKALVDGGSVEYITCKGFSLAVRQVIGKFDGKTLTAYCEEVYIEPEPEEEV